MNRFVITLVWLLVLGIGAVIFDQVMLRVPMRAPVLRESQTFYCDFRARLLALRHSPPNPARSIEEVIEQNRATPSEAPPVSVVERKASKPITPRAPPTVKPPAPTVSAKGAVSPAKEIGGYVFADEQGVLHLVAKLEEVPPKYRPTAQPLKK